MSPPPVALSHADALRGARGSPLAVALVALPLVLLAFFFFRSQGAALRASAQAALTAVPPPA